MKERIKQSGKSLYDEQIKDAQDILADGFTDDVSCAKHIFFWIAGENPQKGNHVYVKLYDRKYSSANGNMKSFLTHNNDRIEVGDYIYDEEENTYWICTESFHVDNIHYEGKFTQCNWCLRWQRPNGTILEYPCLDLNSTQYNSGESGNNTLKLGSSQHMERVQANSDTISLASPQRFYVSRDNSIPYVITQNDTTASNYGKGICNITVSQDVRHENKDRPDLGICDYIDPSSTIPPTPQSPDEMTDLTASIKYRGKPVVNIGGYSKTFSADFSDKSGKILSNIVPIWKITTTDDSVNKYIHSSVKDGKLYVNIDYKESLLGSKIRIDLSDKNNICSSYIIVQIGGGI